MFKLSKSKEELQKELEAAMKAMEVLRKQIETMESEEEEDEEEDLRPLGEKIGSGLGKLISGSKQQGSSFFGGLKDELIKGGVLKPKKKRK